MESPGKIFARAFLERQHQRAGSVFADSGRFFISTPGANVEGNGPSEITRILASFLKPEDPIEIISIEEESIGTRRHLAFRFAFPKNGKNRECEQRAFYDITHDGKISDMRILCSGFLTLED